MEFSPVEYVGLAAGAFTAAAYLPQVYRTWRSKSAEGVSLTMYASTTVGMLLWLVYGVLLRAPAVVIANGVSLLVVGGLLRARLRRHPKSGGPGRSATPGGSNGTEGRRLPERPAA
ncbi:MAG: hypothetical protein AUJ49_09470 [Desulfovibrionaceae bacterium CG1_02_65_16]|nr:MAG: hypothetical protein AUJ49_09470 [Desulfovibrionaceae bacterium CG1_02_65_16]